MEGDPCPVRGPRGIAVEPWVTDQVEELAAVGTHHPDVVAAGKGDPPPVRRPRRRLTTRPLVAELHPAGTVGVDHTQLETPARLARHEGNAGAVRSPCEVAPPVRQSGRLTAVDVHESDRAVPISVLADESDLGFRAERRRAAALAPGQQSPHQDCHLDRRCHE